METAYQRIGLLVCFSLLLTIIALFRNWKFYALLPLPSCYLISLAISHILNYFIGTIIPSPGTDIVRMIIIIPMLILSIAFLSPMVFKDGKEENKIIYKNRVIKYYKSLKISDLLKFLSMVLVFSVGLKIILEFFIDDISDYFISIIVIFSIILAFFTRNIMKLKYHPKQTSKGSNNGNLIRK